jgi:hypothetical protein
MEIYMSNFIHKPGTGSLFPNQFKTKDNQPDLTGTLVMSRDYKAGEKVKVAAWKKTSIKGEFISLSESAYDPQTLEIKD